MFGLFDPCGWWQERQSPPEPETCWKTNGPRRSAWQFEAGELALDRHLHGLAAAGVRRVAVEAGHAAAVEPVGVGLVLEGRASGRCGRSRRARPAPSPGGCLALRNGLVDRVAGQAVDGGGVRVDAGREGVVSALRAGRGRLGSPRRRRGPRRLDQAGVAARLDVLGRRRRGRSSRGRSDRASFRRGRPGRGDWRRRRRRAPCGSRRTWAARRRRRASSEAGGSRRSRGRVLGVGASGPGRALPTARRSDAAIRAAAPETEERSRCLHDAPSHPPQTRAGAVPTAIGLPRVNLVDREVARPAPWQAGAGFSEGRRHRERVGGGGLGVVAAETRGGVVLHRRVPVLRRRRREEAGRRVVGDLLGADAARVRCGTSRSRGGRPGSGRR